MMASFSALDVAILLLGKQAVNHHNLHCITRTSNSRLRRLPAYRDPSSRAALQAERDPSSDPSRVVSDYERSPRGTRAIYYAARDLDYSGGRLT
jgi:hypothetical protein